VFPNPFSQIADSLAKAQICVFFDQDPMLRTGKRSKQGNINAVASFLLRVLTNQIDRTSLAVATNSGSVIEWYYYGTETPRKYFRAMPQ